MKFIRSVPMAICGLALSIAALGNILRPFGDNFRYFCGIVSAAILVVFVLKIILDFPHVREELKTPMPLSVLPTSTMALMLLTIYFRPYLGIAAVCIWYAAVAAHIFIMLLFIKRFVMDFRIETVFPTWFVAFVGIVTVSVTAPAMGAVLLGQMAFYFGFIMYFIALVLIVCAMKINRILPEPARPTIAIFTTPMSLCIVGYFSSFELRNDYLIYIMLAIAAASYLYVSVMMFIDLLHIKFYPTFAAFTFSYVISADAFRIGSTYFAEREVYFFDTIAQVTMWIAVAIVLYVIYHYIRFFIWWLKF